MSVFWDSELVIKQIKGQCQTKHLRMRSYRNKVWDLIENFYSTFDMYFLPREKNSLIDYLVVVASTFKPPENPHLRYQIEFRYRNSIPNNVKYWKVFKYEEQIKHFMEVFGELFDSIIDQGEVVENEQEAVEEEDFPQNDSIENQNIVQLKGTIIPRGLVPLERLFNVIDVPSKVSKQGWEEDIKDCNICKKKQPKLINLEK